MMRVALLCLPGLAQAFGAAYTGSVTGNWSSSATWGGAGVPGAGDTVSINNGVTVAVSDSRIVGDSPVSSVVLALGGSGKLSIASGGTLILRGNATYSGAGGGPGPVQLQIAGGGALVFDSSLAAAPATTHYTYGPNGAYQYSAVSMMGNVGSRPAVSSNAAGGAGAFSSNGQGGYGMAFTAAYVDFLRVGNGSLPMAMAGYVDANASLSITDSTLTSCGEIKALSGVTKDAPFIFDRNIVTASTGTDGPGAFYVIFQDSGSATATHEIVGNVFDADSQVHLASAGTLTISGNYFGCSFSDSGYVSHYLRTNNFVRFYGHADACPDQIGIAGSVSNEYLWADSDHGNPHISAMDPHLSGPSMDGIIFGQFGNTTTGQNDSGELAYQNNADSAQEQPVTRSILLPNAAGNSAAEIGSATVDFPNTKVVIEHNTFACCFPSTGSPVSSLINLSESTGNTEAGRLHSVRSNLVYNPGNTYAVPGFKVLDVGYSATPTQDIGAPSALDYNTGWNIGTVCVYSGCAAYTNKGRGYAAKFSATPGAHDLDIDPAPVDIRRNVELLDSKYLGNSPSAWSSGATYSVGAFASQANAGMYWGLPINYRYTNSYSCAGSNPQPGVGTNWRDCWEPASLYRLRQAIAAGEKWGGVDPNSAMLAWIRFGWSPTNPLLLGAAHDGGDVGAVPVTLYNTTQ